MIANIYYIIAKNNINIEFEFQYPISKDLLVFQFHSNDYTALKRFN